MGTINRSEIQEFYSSRFIFMTGVSGFLGKAILEKLLRSCPHLSRVYVLLRAKHGQDVESRLESILQSPIFETLKEENLSSLDKVVAVAGDITLPNLGLSGIDRETLLENVSIVIHSAASVKFSEPLKTALNINYHGTGRILDLCHEMAHLTALIHVSTAYANCDLPEIPEEIVTPKSEVFTPEQISNMTDGEVAEITEMIVGKKPNTYCYTKWLTENLLKEQRAQLPICIIRPSIIGAAWKEPQPGYVDSLNGMTGLIASAGKGMLTSMVCDADKISDVIPLDVCVNLIIASGWNVAKRRSIDIPVYNCCSGTINPVTNRGVRDYSLAAFEKYPFDGVVRYPYLYFVETHLFNTILNLLFNYLPFFVLDFLAVISRRKLRCLRIFNKVLTAVSSVTYFHLREWKFQTDNLVELESQMSPRDQELFYWDIKQLNYSKYFKNYCLGIKKWIFKEDVKDLPKAFARRERYICIQ